MNKITAILRLTRIEHSLMLIVAVVAAEMVSGGIPSFPILISSLVSPALVSMGAFAINDFYDVKADIANKRFERPLVAKAISPQVAIMVSLLCLVIGTTLSMFINLYAFAIAIIFAALALLYSYKLKDLLLWGNVYIAFTMVIPFVYGDLVVAPSINMDIVLISFVVFLSGLAREIHGMIRDAKGDKRARRSRNLIQYVGINNSSAIALILYAEAIVISIFMFLYSMPFLYNIVYIVPIAISDIMLAYVAVGYRFKSNRRFFDMSRNLSLGAMGLALLAYLLASVVYLV
ncbi:MAG: UbiA family prenyltransferase [Candidatus Marsarchaeota archaeon]|nr:UbiA family prenyltransferase [Candidatus Marsarchaeota archaeon]